MEKMIIDIINNNTEIDKDTIMIYERNTSSLNEFIFFRFNEDSDYYCIIFPTMVIGVGKLTETGEYIRINEMNQRRDEFLSYFAQFIFNTKNLKFYFQQDEFLSDEPLPRESMVWTHIIRMDPNFNYLTDQQLFELQYFKTYDFLTHRSDDHRKLILSNNIHSDFINEVVLIDGFNIDEGKVFYAYPLGRNNNIIKLQMISEISYITLPFIENKLKEIQLSLNQIENDLKILDFSIKTKKADLEDIKKSDIFSKLLDYNNYLNDIERLDINSFFENDENSIVLLFQEKINQKYQQVSDSLEDTIKYRNYLDQYYNNLLDSAYTESTIELQLLAIQLTIIGIILAFIGTIIGPLFYSWCVYNYSTPKFTAHFKPSIGKTYEEVKKQKIILIPNREQLIWIMLHNNGKIIKDHWFCIVDFDKNFEILPIDRTIFNNVDYVKKYSIQKKYNVAHLSR